MVLSDYGVNIIDGSRVIDEEAVLHAVGLDVTFQQVKGVRLLAFTRTDVEF